jgi:hypothetical protein
MAQLAMRVAADVSDYCPKMFELASAAIAAQGKRTSVASLHPNNVLAGEVR